MEHECKCKLDDGRIISYDGCSTKRDAYDETYLIYLGEGIIYSIRGIVQNRTEKLHFWIKGKTALQAYDEL